MKLHLTTSDSEATPAISKISIGGKRFLNADSGNNGWTYSSGVEVVDDLLDMNALPEELIFIKKYKYYSDKLIKSEEQAIEAVKKEILIRQENWYRN